MSRQKTRQKNRAMARMYYRGYKIKDIAKAFGVTPGHVRNVKSKEQWDDGETIKHRLLKQSASELKTKIVAEEQESANQEGRDIVAEQEANVLAQEADMRAVQLELAQHHIEIGKELESLARKLLAEIVIVKNESGRKVVVPGSKEVGVLRWLTELLKLALATQKDAAKWELIAASIPSEHIRADIKLDPGNRQQLIDDIKAKLRKHGIQMESDGDE